MTSLLERASVLFLEVCDLPAHEQQRRLAELERREPALKAKVEELLRGDRAPEPRLEGRALDFLTPTPADTCLAPETLAWMERLTRRRKAPGQYQLRGEIARGGMGTVFEVWDEDLERTLAMKRIAESASAAPSAAIEPAHLARFLNEARITSQLDHPGIVPVHELGMDEHGRPYFTMKRVEGRTLTQVFELVHVGKEGWTLARVLGVFLRLCEAMAFAHSRGVIHRDLKPGNVMVGSFGEVYVMDWGIAKLIGKPSVGDPSSHVASGAMAAQAPGLATADGRVLGTAFYMPPEQASGQLTELGPHSDVYALGAMLYELLARVPPFYTADKQLRAEAIVTAIGAGPPAPLRSLAPRAARELVAISVKAMARDWRARYQDMGELNADLSAFLEDRPGSAWRDGPARRLVKFVRRRPTLFASSLALVLIALLAMILRQESEIGAERVRANVALAETNRVQELALWDEQLVRALHDLRGSDGRYIRGSLEQDYVRWSGDYARVLAELGLALPPSTTEAEFGQRFRALEQRRADQAERVLRALYQLTFRLYQSGASFSDLTRRGLAVPAHPRLPARDWQARLASGLENMQKAPELAALWSPLCSLLPSLDGNEARRRTFAAWQTWLVDRSDVLADDESAFDHPDDVLWFATIVRYMRGAAAGRAPCERAVALDPSSFWAQFDLAAVCSQMTDRRAGMALAMEHASHATVLDPRSGWAFTNLGVYAIELSVEHLKAAERAAPELAAYLRAEVERLRALSITSYEKAIELNPRISVAYSNLANGIEDPERRETLYRQALALEPCLYSTLSSARENLHKAARHAALVEIMEGALACEANAEHHWWLAEALYDLGRTQSGAAAAASFERAEHELALAQEGAPGNSDLLVLGILVQNERAGAEVAVQRIEGILDALEERPDANQRSSLKLYLGRLEAALQHTERGAEALERLHALLDS